METDLNAYLPRPYQIEAVRAFTQDRLRLFCLLWERQSGKSSTFADMSLFQMMRRPWSTCIYASASLLLARELPIKQSQRLELSARRLLQKDSAALQRAALRCSSAAARKGLLFQTADADNDKTLPPLDPDAFAELFQAQKLEFRLYHDRTAYSRTKIIAPNIATARSWTGTVFLDEIAFIPNLKHLLVALLPVISTNRDFKLILATTPPEFDDSHYSFELLAPPAGLAFQPNPAGNWYESQSQIKVHRADAYATRLPNFKFRSSNPRVHRPPSGAGSRLRPLRQLLSILSISPLPVSFPHRQNRPSPPRHPRPTQPAPR